MAKLKELLGKRIKEIRLARNLTQEQLAEIVDIGAASLSKIEIGMNYPSDDNLEKIAKALNVEPYQLFMFNHQKNINELRIDTLSMINNTNNDEIRLVYRILRSILN